MRAYRGKEEDNPNGGDGSRSHSIPFWCGSQLIMFAPTEKKALVPIDRQTLAGWLNAVVHGLRARRLSLYSHIPSQILS